jgi:hypothetical protein
MSTQTFIDQLESIKPTNLSVFLKTLNIGKNPKPLTEQDLLNLTLEMGISTIDFLEKF